jgi:hypothetical protein
VQASAVRQLLVRLAVLGEVTRSARLRRDRVLRLALIDGHSSPLTAFTRERALPLVLPRDQFEQLFNSEDAVARVFLDLIQRDIGAVLRQALRPLARQAWLLSVSPTPASPHRGVE